MNKKSGNETNKMAIHSLFPTPVGVSHLGREITKKEYAFVESQKMYQNRGNLTSVNTNILDELCLKSIRKFIQENLETFFIETVCPNKDVEIYITQSWCNYTKPGGFHHVHQHPNSYISGVFYFAADEDLDDITFHKENKYRQITVLPAEYRTFNYESFFFRIKPGMLVLFPSNLEHFVRLTESTNLRISLSFNTFLKGMIGSKESLTGLHLR